MKDTIGDGCPVEETIELLGGRYTLLVLRALLYAGVALRFGELRRDIPNISQKTLTRTLRQLEERGLLTRTAYAEIPPRVEYALTDAARELMPIFLAMRDWRERHRSLSWD